MAEVWKMAKINNFDEANDELWTVEEKLYCRQAFSHRRVWKPSLTPGKHLRPGIWWHK